MALTLSDRDGDFSIPLVSGQTLGNERSGQVEATPTTGFDSDETFLTSLEQSGRATISGVATGLRLSRRDDYSDVAVNALAEWVAQFLAVVNGAQGEGYRLERTYRGDTFDGLVESLSVSRRGGAALEVGWNLTFVRGQGVATYRAPDPVVALPGTEPYRVAGRELDTVREWEVQKSEELSPVRRTFADSPDENDIVSDAGATKEVTVVGEVVGDATARNQFDADLTATVGKDEFVDVTDALLGTTIQGMVSNYDATDEAGTTRLGEFGVTVIEGQQ